MKAGLNIEDVIEKEFYVDRHGVRHPNKRDGKSIYFLNRVEDLFLEFAKKYAEINASQIEEFIDSYYAINKLLVEYPRRVHKDSNLKNMLISPKRDIVAIDFERLTYMPPQLELIKLLEFGKKEYLSDDDVERLVHDYINLDERLFGNVIDRNNFMDTYHAAGIHNHLCLAGYITSYFHIQDVDRSEFFVHLDRSKRHLEKLVSEGKSLPDDYRMATLLGVIDSLRGKDIDELASVNY